MKYLVGDLPRYVELCKDSHLTIGHLRDPPFNEHGEKWIVVLYEQRRGRCALPDVGLRSTAVGAGKWT